MKFIASIAVAAVVIAIAGCGREEIKTYRVAKEQPRQLTVQSDEAPPPAHADVETLKPQLSWTLPAGWKEGAPTRMSVATFTIAGPNGTEANVNVTPLRSFSGKEVQIVNLWRGQIGLAEISAEEAAKQLKPVDIGGEPGKLFELTAEAANAKSPARIVTAMVHRQDASWFYKLVGDSELVEAQKPAFIEFLKSIKVSEVPAAEVAVVKTSQTETPAATTSKWKTPLDWKEVAPGQMQVAKFSVPDKGAAKADVTISVFPSSTGGSLANVNRWRGQVGLPPVDETELPKLITKLDEKNSDSILADMSGTSVKTGKPARLIGAIVPRDGQWFFYKLMGDPDAVAAQKDAFVSFAKVQR